MRRWVDAAVWGILLTVGARQAYYVALFLWGAVESGYGVVWVIIGAVVYGVWWYNDRYFDNEGEI